MAVEALERIVPKTLGADKAQQVGSRRVYGVQFLELPSNVQLGSFKR